MSKKNKGPSQDGLDSTGLEKHDRNISFSVPQLDDNVAETEDVEVNGLKTKKQSQIPFERPATSFYKSPRSSTKSNQLSGSDKPGSSRLSSVRGKPVSRTTTLSLQSSTDSEAMSLDEDVITMTVLENSQKIVHCLVGKDLFVDKTWCMVKKADILEDVAIQDSNSPFFNFTHKILAYKPNELLIGYEPFSSSPNQFMLCVTEEGRDQVLNQLEALKSSYLRRIEQSKEVEPRKWESQGSEEFVDQFQIRKTRKLISLEWIGDITKRCFSQPKFEDCDPDSMKNGYSCLVPTDKEKFELIYKKTQETGIQAVAMLSEAGVQTDPEIPTNASTQYAPETEITVPDTSVTQTAITSQDLNAFFQKYLDYLCDCLKYNEVYDLYHDDYPALYVTGEETQVQQLGTYHQYQSFTDVAAIEGKLVVSSSWHPNFTGIVAVAYADEIPCLMKELEFDSDQTDYEEEKTDEEAGEGAEETDLGAGARDWLLEEKRERESPGENTELYEKALKRLRDIECDKVIWDAKIQEETEEVRKPVEETESDSRSEVYVYTEYKEPELELELEELEEEDEGEGEERPESFEVREGEEEEQFGTLGKEDTGSPKTNKTSFREQLEADLHEHTDEMESPVSIRQFDEESEIMSRRRTQGTQDSKLHPSGFSRSTSEGRSFSRTMTSDGSLSKRAHHRKKHRRNVTSDGRHSQLERDSESTARSSLSSSYVSGSFRGRADTSRDIYPAEQHHELFDEVTDEEEIKEKQDELPLLELNNPVLVWSFVDDLTPKLRLDSPYEVRVVEFSRHNGNLIAGGTISGQVVLWDITGRIEELERPESLTPNQQKIRKRMEDLMNWRRDVRSKRRVPISAISSQPDSHLEKVTQLLWVSPSVLVTETVDIIENPSSEPNLQLITCSIHGDIKLWDLQSQPMKMDVKKQVQQFKTKARFGRPAMLDSGRSPFTKLHRRWKPFSTIMTSFRNVPVLLTGMHCHQTPIKYVRAIPKLPGVKEVLEDRIEFKASQCNVFFSIDTTI